MSLDISNVSSLCGAERESFSSVEKLTRLEVVDEGSSAEGIWTSNASWEIMLSLLVFAAFVSIVGESGLGRIILSILCAGGCGGKNRTTVFWLILFFLVLVKETVY